MIWCMGTMKDLVSTVEGNVQEKGSTVKDCMVEMPGGDSNDKYKHTETINWWKCCTTFIFFSHHHLLRRMYIIDLNYVGRRTL